jgi:hypothetical protein
VIYAACLLTGLIPALTPGANWVGHFWLGIPFSIIATFAPIALFLTAFVINEKRAILVPIAGVFASALLLHYFRHVPHEYEAAFEQVRLRHDLWQAIKFDLPEALLVTGLGIVAARSWSQRIKSDPTRTALPEVMPALIFFAASLILYTLLIVFVQHGHLTHYPFPVLESAAGTFSIIAIFCLCAVTFKPWTALLPLAYLAASVAVTISTPGGCFDVPFAECWDWTRGVLRTEFVVMMTVFFAGVLAGLWAREGEEPAS